jgi:pimeloyl-ACP methyl ester carboxylesterase
VRDTEAFVERHLGQPTVLIGFSTGALVALGVAAQLPKLVRAIVLLDPGLILRNSSFSTIAFSDAYDWLTWVNATLTSAHTLEEVLARCKEQMPDEAEAQSRAKMLHSLDPQSVAVILNDQFYGGLDLEQVLRQVA